MSTAKLLDQDNPEQDSDDPQALADLLALLKADRILAHEYLFKHRHPDETPEMHHEIILDYYSEHRQIVTEAFRGGAKSTIAEEGFIIEALFEEFRNGIVLGENEPRAKERLTAIKYEIENNEKILAIWGDMVGVPWGEAKVRLRNGVFLQALGRDQSMRGVKDRDQRPDRLLVDDYEDEESVQTPEARKKVSDKFFGVVLPALDKRHSKVRVIGTPLDVQALVVTLSKLPGWRSKKFPIEYVPTEGPDAGKRVPMWPGRWSLEEIDALKQSLVEAGKSEIWEREYMLNAVDEASKPFKRLDFKIEQLTHTWEPVYVIYDPARTTKTATSAHTGKVVMSWIKNRIVVWESSGNFWKPDEIVNDMFEMDEKYSPVAIGVEINGLHEFLMQPIRHAQMQRSRLLPVRALSAPKNKIDFIKGLQPFAKAGEIILNGEQLQFLEQFDQFPRGRIDIPNAAAYLPRIRTGVPVYRSFDHVHVATELRAAVRVPMFLCINAGIGVSTAALVQINDGQMCVLGDWVSDKPIGDVIYNVLRDVGMEFGSTDNKPRVIAPVSHWTDYNSLGVVAAAKAVPVELYKGGDLQQGRMEIRSLLERSPAGRPGVQVSRRASWVLRAMTEGYAYDIEKTGRVSDEPMENVYRTLIEGLEGLMALSRLYENPDDSPRRVEYTSDGRAYTSARAIPR